jgi:hypothetical protein
MKVDMEIVGECDLEYVVYIFERVLVGGLDIRCGADG